MRHAPEPCRNWTPILLGRVFIEPKPILKISPLLNEMQCRHNDVTGVQGGLGGGIYLSGGGLQVLFPLNF